MHNESHVLHAEMEVRGFFLNAFWVLDVSFVEN